jgi:hypothetical protein
LIHTARAINIKQTSTTTEIELLTRIFREARTDRTKRYADGLADIRKTGECLSLREPDTVIRTSGKGSYRERSRTDFTKRDMLMQYTWVGNSRVLLQNEFGSPAVDYGNLN